MSSSMHITRARNWVLQFPPVEWAASQLREVLMAALRQGPIPQHVAFVMDGNRRFARSRQIETAEGHNHGFEALARILEVCYKTGVRVVTVYAFSVENYSRSRHEVEGLMALAKLKLQQLAAHGELLARYGARIQILGRRELIREDVLRVVEEVEALTANNGDAVLNVCFPYTSRDEITAAVRQVVDEWSKPITSTGQNPKRAAAFSERHITQSIRSRHLTGAAEEVVARSRANSPQPSNANSARGSAEGSAAGSDAEQDAASSTASTLQVPSESTAPTSADGEKLATAPAVEVPAGSSFPDVEAIDEAALDGRMLTAGMPPLDLLVRTSGVERFSDFLLWQAHDGADVAFSKCFWPEFDLWHFLPVLLEWQWRRRREAREGGGRADKAGTKADGQGLKIA